MNVLKENTVSEYFLQRSLTGFPELCQTKKQKKNRKTQKLTLTHQIEHKKM